jgi:hypothetical protein
VNDLPEIIKQVEQLSPESRAILTKYIEFLQWQESKDRFSTADWSYSFVEAFKEANVQASQNPDGMDITMAPALVGGESRPALWAHPPVVGQAMIEYFVPIPQEVSHLHLRLALGIRDGAEISENNLVAFGVRVNGLRVWGQQTNAQTWAETTIPLNIQTGDIVRIAFTTEALVNHQWTWAVWGNPELYGTKKKEN